MYRVRDMSMYNSPELMVASETIHEFVNDEITETISSQEKLTRICCRNDYMSGSKKITAHRHLYSKPL